MKLILEPEEALSIIHSALCNGGLSQMESCGVILSVSNEEYSNSRQQLVEGGKKDICREDVWVQILRTGKPLKFFDFEGNEEQEFTLDKAIEELGKEDAFDLVNTFIDEDDDADTGFELFQLCLYGEIIFG